MELIEVLIVRYSGNKEYIDIYKVTVWNSIGCEKAIGVKYLEE